MDFRKVSLAVMWKINWGGIRLRVGEQRVHDYSLKFIFRTDVR